jgi:hypothetical protein
MKTILKIVIILLAAAIVCGGYFLIGSNTTIAAGPGGEGERPALGTRPEGGMPPDGNMKQRPEGTAPDGTVTERPQGQGEGGGSAGAGLAEVLISIAKLAGITAAVLIVEKGINLLSKRTLKTAAS